MDDALPTDHCVDKTGSPESRISDLFHKPFSVCNPGVSSLQRRGCVFHFKFGWVDTRSLQSIWQKFSVRVDNILQNCIDKGKGGGSTVDGDGLIAITTTILHWLGKSSISG